MTGSIRLVSINTVVAQRGRRRHVLVGDDRTACGQTIRVARSYGVTDANAADVSCAKCSGFVARFR